MMMNRLAGCFPEEESPPHEFYTVAAPFGSLCVSRDEAHRMVKLLCRLIPPRWICVRDVSGSETWIRSKLIGGIVESTAAQRARDRQLRRDLEQEDKGSSEWM